MKKTKQPTPKAKAKVTTGAKAKVPATKTPAYKALKAMRTGRFQ
jgi:nucleoid DNA-binding protein